MSDSHDPSNPSWARVRRAERFFLRWTAPSAPVPKHEDRILTACLITQGAQEDLSRLLARRGSWQGGPVFGARSNGILHVQFMRPGGYWPMIPDGDPYAMDMGYMLGLSDAQSPVQVDWQGHWLAAPDCMMPEDVTAWADEGRVRGLIDDAHPLIVVGDDRDGLSYWGLLWEPGERQWKNLKIIRP